jgi:hypothetical protein
MATVTGVVMNGIVVPNSPLPEGARVEIYLDPSSIEMEPELKEELMAWQQGNAEALALVERLAQEDEANEKR